MSSRFELANKTILITGASSGIGRGIAIALNEAGAHVLIIAREYSRLLETKQLLSNPDKSQIIQADLTQLDNFKQLVTDLPPLDGVVFAAGIIQTVPFKFISQKALNEVMKINFESPTLFMQQLIKQQKIRAGGSIVYLSSIAGTITGSLGNAMYSASKGALQASIKVLALELASKKIRVNSIAPGMVKTEMWLNGSTITEEQLIEDEKKYPLGYGKAEDISGLAHFLLSDASRWITGTMIVADGGYTIQ